MSRGRTARGERRGVIVGEIRVETLAASQKRGEGLFDDSDYDLTLISDRYRAASHIQYARSGGAATP